MSEPAVDADLLKVEIFTFNPHVATHVEHWRASIKVGQRLVKVEDYDKLKADLDAEQAARDATAILLARRTLQNEALQDACRQVLNWYDVEPTDYNRDMAVRAVRQALASTSVSVDERLRAVEAENEQLKIQLVLLAHR